MSQPQSEQARVLQARDAEERGLFDEAVVLYEQVAQVQPSTRAAEALLQATRLRLGLGQLDEARRNAASYERLLEGKTVQGLLSIRLLLARNHAHHERWSELLTLLKTSEPLLSRGTRAQLIEARLLKLRGLANSGQTRQAEAEARGLLALQIPREPPPEELQEAQFFLANQVFEQAHALRIPRYDGPVSRENIDKFYTSRLTPWHHRKLAAVERAAKQFQGVIDHGSSTRWVIASAARVGLLWSRFTQDIRTVPSVTIRLAPGAYIDPIEDPPSEVFKQRAKHAFEVCLEQAKQQKWYDENVAICEEELLQIARMEYPTGEGYRLPPVLPSNLVSPRWTCLESPSPAAAPPRCGWSQGRPHFSSHLWPQKQGEPLKAARR